MSADDFRVTELIRNYELLSGYVSELHAEVSRLKELLCWYWCTKPLRRPTHIDDCSCDYCNAYKQVSFLVARL